MAEQREAIEFSQRHAFEFIFLAFFWRFWVEPAASYSLLTWLWLKFTVKPLLWLVVNFHLRQLPHYTALWDRTGPHLAAYLFFSLWSVISQSSLIVADSRCGTVVQGRWTTCLRRSEHCATPGQHSPTHLWRHRCVVLRAVQCWLACMFTIISRTPTMTTVHHCSGVRRTSRAVSALTFTTPDIALVCTGKQY